MHKLIDYICDELNELERKADKEGKLSMSEAQYGDLLAHFKKNLLTADAMMDEYDYSERGGRGMVYRDGGNYRGGMSNARGRTGNVRRDSRGRYASNGGYYSATDDVMDGLERMMDESDDEKTRAEIRKFMSKLEQMS